MGEGTDVTQTIQKHLKMVFISTSVKYPPNNLLIHSIFVVNIFNHFANPEQIP